MAARERKPGESFEDYRENLRREDAMLKRRLAGRLFWETERRGQYIRTTEQQAKESGVIDA